MTYNDEELIQITESLKQEWIDKACKWLYVRLYNGRKLTSNLIDDLREYMEE